MSSDALKPNTLYIEVSGAVIKGLPIKKPVIDNMIIEITLIQWQIRTGHSHT